MAAIAAAARAESDDEGDTYFDVDDQSHTSEVSDNDLINGLPMGLPVAAPTADSAVAELERRNMELRRQVAQLSSDKEHLSRTVDQLTMAAAAARTTDADVVARVRQRMWPRVDYHSRPDGSGSAERKPGASDPSEAGVVVVPAETWTDDAVAAAFTIQLRHLTSKEIEIAGAAAEAGQRIARAALRDPEKAHSVPWVSDFEQSGSATGIAIPSVVASAAHLSQAVDPTVAAMSAARATAAPTDERTPLHALSAPELLARLEPVLSGEPLAKLHEALHRLRAFPPPSAMALGGASSANGGADYDMESEVRRLAAVNGRAMADINMVADLLDLRKGGARVDSIKTLAVLLAGYESAGKTLLLDAFLGIHIGSSGHDRETFCPINYSVQYDESAVQPICQVSTDPLEPVQLQREISAAELQAILQAHMDKIKRDHRGAVVSQPVFVTIRYAGALFSGTIIDCPGYNFNTAKTGAKAEKDSEIAVQKIVREIIGTQLRAADKEAFVISVENVKVDPRHRPYFFVEELLGQDRELYEGRIAVVCTHTDALFLPAQDPRDPHRRTMQWPPASAQAERREAVARFHDLTEAVNTNGGSGAQLMPFFVTLVGIENFNKEHDARLPAGRAAAHRGVISDPMQLDEERRRIIEDNESQLRAAFQFSLGADDAHAQRCGALLPNMSLAAFRRSVILRRSRGIGDAVTACLEQVRLLTERCAALNSEISAAASVSRISVSDGVHAAWESFWSHFEELLCGHSSTLEFSVQVNMDMDADPQLASLHSKFPLLLSETLDGGGTPQVTLQDALRHVGTLATECPTRTGLEYCTSQEDFCKVIRQLMEESISDSEMVYLNLEQAFQRVVFCFLLRCSSVVLHTADAVMMHIGGGAPKLNMYYQHSEDAIHKVVTQIHRAFWDRALGYLRHVLRHFITRAIDAALFNCRIATPGTGASQVPVLFYHRHPFTVFRVLLLRGGYAFVDEHMSMLQRELHLGSEPPEHLRDVQRHHARIWRSYDTALKSWGVRLSTTHLGWWGGKPASKAPRHGASAKRRPTSSAGGTSATTSAGLPVDTTTIPSSSAGAQPVEEPTPIDVTRPQGIVDSLGQLMRAQQTVPPHDQLFNSPDALARKMQWAQLLYNFSHGRMLMTTHGVLTRRMFHHMRHNDGEDSLQRRLRHEVSATVLELRYRDVTAPFQLGCLEQNTASIRLVAPLVSEALVRQQRHLYGWDQLYTNNEDLLKGLQAAVEALDPVRTLGGYR
jgi:hypothetical protein